MPVAIHQTGDDADTCKRARGISLVRRGINPALIAIRFAQPQAPHDYQRVRELATVAPDMPMVPVSTIRLAPALCELWRHLAREKIQIGQTVYKTARRITGAAQAL